MLRIYAYVPGLCQTSSELKRGEMNEMRTAQYESFGTIMNESLTQNQ